MCRQSLTVGNDGPFFASVKMRLTFLMVLALSAFGQRTHAQGEAGCSLDQFLGGLTPYYENHYIGLKYDIAPYTGTLYNQDQIAHDHKETYHIMELFGRYSFSNRWFLHGHIPVYYGKMEIDHHPDHTEFGLGDIFASLHYKIWIHEDEGHHGPVQELSAGIGLNLPTGTIHLPEEGAHELPDFLFTHSAGSWNFFLISEYLYRGEAAGFAIESFAEFTTTNHLGHRYGNRFAIGGSAFYRAQWGNTFWVPNMGYRYEYIGDAESGGIVLLNSSAGFNILRAGMDAYFGPITVGGEALFPVGNREILGLEASIHGAFYIRYLFGQNKGTKSAETVHQ